MKELSIEEKAKAYDEALKVLRKYDDANIILSQSLKEEMFPELAENRDEKVKKSINRLIRYYHDVNFPTPEGFSRKDLLDWVEKQGEQKPTDKVEPKFKVGDWIVSNGHLICGNSLMRIVKVGLTDYLCRYCNGQTTYCREFIDKSYHLWTIQDARDGDVLVNGSNIFIFHFINGTRLMGYCHVNTDDGKFYNDIGKNECFCLIDAVVNPATKEQRNLLFQKMHEAGYEWDAEKKELMKIEQKPWSEEDERIRQDIENLIHFALEDGSAVSPAAHTTKEEAISWIQFLKDRYTWRPSDRQIEILKDFLFHIPIEVPEKVVLVSLYHDLLKLNE